MRTARLGQSTAPRPGAAPQAWLCPAPSMGLVGRSWSDRSQMCLAGQKGIKVQTEFRLLISWPQIREIILDYPVGLMES